MICVREGFFKSMFSSSFLETLLLTVSEGVVVYDENGKIIFCNDAGRDMLGMDENKLLGKRPGGLDFGTIREDGSLFPTHDHPISVTLRTGQPCRNVVMGLVHNPSRPCLWISINTGIIPGHKSQAFAVFTDITPHIEAKRYLQDSKRLLRIVMRSIPDPVWLKNPDGVYLSCNQEFERLFNVKEADLLGKTDYDFIDRELADFFRKSDREAIESGKPQVREALVPYPCDGRLVRMETIKTPVWSERGDLIGVLGIARNVTDRSELVDELDKLVKQSLSLQDRIPIGLSIFDFNRCCVEANEAFLAIFGMGKDDIMGQSSRLLYRDEETYESVGAALWPIITAGGIYRADVEMRHADGTDILVRQMARLLHPNDPKQGVILTLQDVTNG